MVMHLFFYITELLQPYLSNRTLRSDRSLLAAAALEIVASTLENTIPSD